MAESSRRHTRRAVRFREIGRATPLSVLPLGTANNLARTLGFMGQVKRLIESIASAEPGGFDVGLARGLWGNRYFMEGAGAGLLAEYLHGPKKQTKTRKSASKEEEMREHVVSLRKFLANFSARKWSLTLDGEELSGRYLLFEAMNICSIGPVLHLAPHARTSDGRFDFVAAKESDRGVLLRYLDARLQGKKPAFPLRARKFRHRHLDLKNRPVHLDDAIWPPDDEAPKKSGEIEIIVQPSALTVLRPHDAN